MYKTIEPYHFTQLPAAMREKAEKILADISPLGEVNEGTVDAKEAWSREDVLVLMRAMYNEALRQPRPIPADIREAEIKKINITPSEVRYVIDAIPGYAGIFMTEDDAKKGLAIFKAGMLAERERMMKEAPVAEVRGMGGGTDAPFFFLDLTFRKMPRFELSGKPVRVIIEEIK